MSKQNNSVTITLNEPLQQGKGEKATTITEVTLRKPNSGELRGTKLADLLQMDTDAVATVAERITEPEITSNDFFKLDPADITDIALEVVGFLNGRR
ncbi:MAG: phage tail assembly protein [Candidatus Sedimenticola sp. (ex Thyasira tokunagai)]